MGKRLIPLLINEGCSVKALVRKGSESKVPNGCAFVIANPFEAETFTDTIPENAVFIQLLGVPHPGPSKKELFKTIDLASVKASANAALHANASHFIYVSAAQTPTNIMKDFQQSRAEAESIIQSTGIPATFIRPWYVIGPGHYWPLLLQPMFKILQWIPSTSEKAKALRLIYLSQMLKTLVSAVKKLPQNGMRIIKVDEMSRM